MCWFLRHFWVTVLIFSQNINFEGPCLVWFHMDIKSNPLVLFWEKQTVSSESTKKLDREQTDDQLNWSVNISSSCDRIMAKSSYCFLTSDLCLCRRCLTWRMLTRTLRVTWRTFTSIMLRKAAYQCILFCFLLPHNCVVTRLFHAFFSQIDVSANRKAVVIHVPYRLRKAFRKIHLKLVRELEKKFSGKVTFLFYIFNLQVIQNWIEVFILPNHY